MSDFEAATSGDDLSDAPGPALPSGDTPRQRYPKSLLPGLVSMVAKNKSNLIELATRVGIKRSRIYRIANRTQQAEPWEIARVMEALNATYETLTTEPFEPVSLPITRRRRTESVSPLEKPMTERDEEQASLTLVLPNGQQTTILTSETITTAITIRMARALAVMFNLKDE